VRNRPSYDSVTNTAFEGLSLYLSSPSWWPYDEDESGDSREPSETVHDYRVIPDRVGCSCAARYLPAA
jgi:hypothetical protein